MEQYLPYIATVLCSLISYLAARRQSKADLQRLQKQHELDIEKERELFAMEKEKLELTHKFQLELKDKELESQLGANVTSALFTEVMKMPEMRQQIAQGIRKRDKK